LINSLERAEKKKSAYKLLSEKARTDEDIFIPRFSRIHTSYFRKFAVLPQE